MSPSRLITSFGCQLPTAKMSSPNSENDVLLVVEPSSDLFHPKHDSSVELSCLLSKSMSSPPFSP
uniref:Uncharacterized protein n=1 Tax=Rhizophora mucronata TaxID=61149 RepID=A0A2P2NUI0_RHIMU